MSKRDAKAKEYLQDNERFADLFNYCLFGGEQVIFPDDLSERDSAEKISIKDAVSQERLRDLLKFAIVKQNRFASFVLLGLEIQDKVHYAMPVRILLYDAMQYVSQVKQIANKHQSFEYDDASEFLSKFKKTDRIMPVITLVLFLSASEWDGPRSLYDVMDIPDPAWKQFVNDYPLHLIIPAEIDDFDKFQTEVGALLEIVKASNDKMAIERLVHSKEQYYYLHNETIQTINTIVGTHLKINETERSTNMWKGWEDLVNDSKSEGRTEGLVEGRVEGRVEGCSEFSNAVKLIRKGTDTLEGLTANGISEATAKMALEAMFDPV